MAEIQAFAISKRKSKGYGLTRGTIEWRGKERREPGDNGGGKSTGERRREGGK